MLNYLRRGLHKLGRESGGRSKPIISFVVIVYDMPDQAQNTARSLFVDYQLGARSEDYEVLIVENESAHTLPRGFIDSLPSNFSYHLRKETQPTPVHAINYGIGQARGENICVMIDGARMLTPGVLKNMILGHRLSSSAIVTVPGYHLGYELQQTAVASGYGVEQEQALMNSISWPADGYRLFGIACFSGSCAAGFYNPHSESNCISLPRHLWQDLGGYDPRFDARGGGVVNLDLYKRACEHPGSLHVFLHGEGTFHQFHGGVSTGGEDSAARDKYIESIMDQYESIRGQRYSSPQTEPVFLGEVSGPALKFVQLSAQTRLETMQMNAEAKAVQD